jgi:hypothetical protein
MIAKSWLAAFRGAREDMTVPAARSERKRQGKTEAAGAC